MKLEKISITELWERFRKNNDARPIIVEEALVVFKNKAYADDTIKRPTLERVFKFSSDSKCFQSWMGGYSCFAVNTFDTNIVWRIERMLNEAYVEEVYLIKGGN